MKETNQLEESLCKYVLSPGEKDTLNNLARWATSVPHLPNIPVWSTFNVVDRIGGYRERAFDPVCVMNIKKSYGGSTAVYKELILAVERDKEFIRRQVELYNPDVAVCCGSVVFELLHSKVYPVPRINSTSNGIDWFLTDGRIAFVSFYHPGAHYPAHLMCYGLLLAVKEILEMRRGLGDEA